MPVFITSASIGVLFPFPQKYTHQIERQSCLNSSGNQNHTIHTESTCSRWRGAAGVIKSVPQHQQHAEEEGAALWPVPPPPNIPEAREPPPCFTLQPTAWKSRPPPHTDPRGVNHDQRPHFLYCGKINKCLFIAAYSRAVLWIPSWAENEKEVNQAVINCGAFSLWIYKLWLSQSIFI